MSYDAVRRGESLFFQRQIYCYVLLLSYISALYLYIDPGALLTLLSFNKYILHTEFTVVSCAGACIFWRH
jgi:hypothetical protein